jgi:AraC-like DNA-binding protein
MPSHTHPAYTFIYYFQTVIDFIVEGKHLSYDLADGKCLSAMSPGIPHQEMEEEHFQSYIAVVIEAKLFQETAMQYLKTIPVFRGEAYTPHPELLNLLRCFMLETSQSGGHNPALANSLAMIIAHYVVLSIIPDTQTNLPLFIYDRFEIDRAIAYMNSHLSEKITLEDLAGQVNLSTGHFSKIFKSVTGETPIEFLNTIRLQKARHLLINNTDNITEIALKCGFRSSAYFSTCFIEKYRMTPSSFRQKVLKSKEITGY